MHKASRAADLFAKLANDELSEVEAKAAGERMEGVARILKIREEERAREQLAEWITQMLDESVGKLHRWTKDDDPTRGMAVQWDEKTLTFISTTNEVLKQSSEEWAKTWQCGMSVSKLAPVF